MKYLIQPGSDSPAMGYAQKKPDRPGQARRSSGRTTARPSENLSEIVAEAHRQQTEKLMRRKKAQHQRDGRPGRAQLATRCLLFLIPALVIVILMNVWMAQRVKAPFTPQEEWVAARSLIYLTASAVEAYRASEGTLPQDLAQIEQQDDQVTYRPTEDTYTLTIHTTSETVTYHRGDDLEPFKEDWVAVCTGTEP